MTSCFITRHFRTEETMKNNNTKLTIILGILCFLLMAAASWYTVAYNDSRLLSPINLAEYTFRTQDLPMLISTVLFILYFFYLFLLLIREIIANKRTKRTAQDARHLDPRLGCFGFLGFLGFIGFRTYITDREIFPFVFFLFFGFFGFFYEGKMSDTFMDERYRENELRAQAKANQIASSIILLACVIVGQGKLMGNLEYTLIAFLIVVVLSIALDLFLSKYLLYRYDHGSQFDESED